MSESQIVPMPRFTKVYVDENLNVSTQAYERARAKGVSKDYMDFMRERVISHALDCSRAKDGDQLLLQQGKLAEAKELLALFENPE